MTARRPDLKRPGITATGRQWQTIRALREDGWIVLEGDPALWTVADVKRLVALLAQRSTAVGECRDD